MDLEQVTWRIIGAAMRIHNTLGPGFLESVYENAMMHELEKLGIAAVRQQPVPVYYDGVIVGDFIADIYVPDCLIVELKAVQVLAPAHTAQLVNYLNATRIEDGLLINFGAASLDYHHRYRTFRRKKQE